MPRIPGLLERIQQPLYDTLIVKPGTNHYKFFQEPLSTSARTSVFESSFLDDQKDPTLKCSLCKEVVFGFENITPGFLNSLHRCNGCRTVYHKSCFREMFGCATMGCSQKGKKLSDTQPKVKTLVDTNMDVGGTLPYPKNFEIHAISLHFDKTVDKYELEAFKEYSSYKLYIGTKTYLDMPVAVLDDLQNGNYYGYSLADPIDLIPMMHFCASLTYEGSKKSDATFRVRNVLQGFFKREVH
jgi:hypothetical protein